MENKNINTLNNFKLLKTIKHIKFKTYLWEEIIAHYLISILELYTTFVLIE